MAGVVVFVSERVVKLQYVGYSDGAAMSAIYAHLFGLPEFSGRWFDFGTSMGEAGVVERGLLGYKESLGGRLAVLRRYRIAIDSPVFERC